MKYFKIVLIVVLFNSCFSIVEKSQIITTNLNQDWIVSLQNCAAGQGAKLMGTNFTTSIPTTIHLDLLFQKKIPDPFIKDNYLKVKWIQDCSVKYTKKFTISNQIQAYQHTNLVFQGIDTYGSITLNGQNILKTQNAFRQYQIDITSYLKSGENILQVKIEPSKIYDDQGQRSDPMPFKYAHTRKACYQYSWDWAPEINTVGIWKSVKLQSYNAAMIDYVWVRNRMITKQKATINFAIALKVGNNEQIENRKYLFEIKRDGKSVVKGPITNKYTYQDIQIQNPKLWWPNGFGQPFIYNLQVSLLYKSGKSVTTIHSKKIPYGIRTVQLDQKNNKFTVIVNGYPVYCKGANYVPPDMLYPRLTNPRYKPGNTIKQLIQDAKDSNYNMIRLWGGGQYQSDQFYQLTSRNGIMIFYDFMFSDSVYPSTQAFLRNVQEQIKQQIRRVRNYPSLALWSGNNQILQGIYSWGWGTQRYKKDYQRLFQDLIPKIINHQSPYISYIPSSPVYGVGNGGFQRGGDIHYWGVWAAGAGFQSYQTAFGPFNSEFGTQALPVWQTICQFTDPNDRSYNSGILLTHQRHGSGFSTLKRYMDTYAKKSINFEMQAYQSGLIQAFAIEIAIKAQRTSKPKSFGTLYWQMNDAWPAISWSSIDYFGRWKPLQYMAKRLYPNVAIIYSGNKIYAINDDLYKVEAVAEISVVQFDGLILTNDTLKIALAPNQVQVLKQLPQSKIAKPDKTVIYTKIIAGKNKIMTSTHFFRKFIDLDLPKGQLTVQYFDDLKAIKLTSDKLLKNVFISNSQQYIKLSDNYFDLIPKQPVTVKILSDKPINDLKKSMVYRSYRQVYENEPLKVKVI